MAEGIAAALLDVVVPLVAWVASCTVYLITTDLAPFRRLAIAPVPVGQPRLVLW